MKLAEKVTIQKPKLPRAILKGMNFNSCAFERLTASFDKLEGCIVTSEQAIGFSKLLGSVLKEEERRPGNKGRRLFTRL